jgi:hypothetical protein
MPDEPKLPKLLDNPLMPELPKLLMPEPKEPNELLMPEESPEPKLLRLLLLNMLLIELDEVRD